MRPSYVHFVVQEASRCKRARDDQYCWIRGAPGFDASAKSRVRVDSIRQHRYSREFHARETRQDVTVPLAKQILSRGLVSNVWPE